MRLPRLGHTSGVPADESPAPSLGVRVVSIAARAKLRQPTDDLDGDHGNGARTTASALDRQHGDREHDS